jgi:hypothetical protein
MSYFSLALFFFACVVFLRHEVDSPNTWSMIFPIHAPRLKNWRGRILAISIFFFFFSLSREQKKKVWRLCVRYSDRGSKAEIFFFAQERVDFRKSLAGVC